jgi:glycosyltransferase involved in cell wall biosynthesis
MRILMTNWVYYPEFSGGSLQCHRLTKKLIKLGVQVDVLAGTNNKAQIGGGVVQNVNVCRVLRDRSTTKRKLKYGWALFHYILKNKGRYDILHSHGFHASVNLAAWITRIPLVQKITNSNVDDPITVSNRKYGFIFSLIYKIARLIIPTSNILEASCKRGLKNTPYIKIPNGVDTESYYPPVGYEKYQLRDKYKIDRDKIILSSVGTVSHIKGTDLLIEAFYHLKENCDEDIVLWIIGPTSFSHGYNMADLESIKFSQKIKKMVSYHGLDDIVYFMGEQRATNEYLRASDIYVHPSRQEGQPNAVLEAMATGLPVVANLLPGITDDIINPGQCGYVVNCEDTKKFASALKVLVNNQGIRKRLGINARKEILKNYDLNLIAKRYLNSYNTILNKDIIHNDVDFKLLDKRILMHHEGQKR